MFTIPFAPGFQFGSTSPVLRMCARLLRATEPTSVKFPPMYQPPKPSATTVVTAPLPTSLLTRGKVRLASPVVPSSAAPAPVFSPAEVKLPPR